MKILYTGISLISVVTAGIAVEVATKAAAGHLIITSDSLVSLIGGMLFFKIFRKQ